MCGGEPLASEDVLDLLGSLIEKSLVMLEERDDGARYLMLETIREYAREKLAQRDDAAAAAARHCDHYFAMAKAARNGLRGPQQADWLWKVEVELDNIRSAIALSLAGGVDPFIAVKFAVAMQGFWILRGYSTEGRKLVQAALALPAIQASPIAQAFALYVGAALAESQSDHAEARKMLETCLELRRALGSEVDIAATLVDAVARPPPGAATPSRRPRARARRCRSSGASATASARRSACCISARSACTRATTRWPARTSSSAWRSPARSVTRRSRANASWCSAKSRSRRPTRPRPACASSAR